LWIKGVYLLKQGVKMSTTRTKPILTIFILLIVLAVLSAASLLTSQLGGQGRVRPGNFVRTPGPNGANGGGGFQGGNRNGGGGNAGGSFQGGNGGGGGNFQGRGGGGAFAIFGAARSLGLNPQVFFFAGIGISVLGILLALLCAYGIWKQKKVALNWAMVLALLFLLGALPGLLFGGARFNLVRTVMEVLNVGAAATILVLGVLPSVRDSVE
jgi:hypothetical protein